MDSHSHSKSIVLLLFACAIGWIAAASVEQAMVVSGASREERSTARKGRMQLQIEILKAQIEADSPAKTAADSLNLAGKLEEMATLLWQDGRAKEALEALTRALSLEKQGGADKNRLIATLNQIASVCRDSNRYNDMHMALRQIQTLNDHDPATTIEVRIRDRQNIASCNFLMAVQEEDQSKRKQQLQLTQTSMEELKRELLTERAIDKLDAGEKSLLATIDDNLSSIFEELGDRTAAKPLKEEAQRLRSAGR